jgi:hypothetical protein
LLASGAEADVHEHGPGLVLKLWRDRTGAARAAEEARRTALLAAAGVRVAAVHAQVVVDGRAGLVLDRIDGVDLARRLAQRPWAVDAVARQLAAVQLELHARPAPDGLPDLVDQLVGRLDPLPLELRRLTERRVGALPPGDRLLHGNLHLGNAVAGPAGPVLVDWGDVARGPAVAEVAHTLVRYRLARLRAQASAPVRALSGPGRALLRARYLAHYARAGRLDAAELQSWIRVRAAERLAEGNAWESAALQRLLAA